MAAASTYTTILDLMFDARGNPISQSGNLAFLHALGNKYMHEGYVRIDTVFKESDIGKAFTASNATKDTDGSDYQKTRLLVLKLLLADSLTEEVKETLQATKDKITTAQAVMIKKNKYTPPWPLENHFTELMYEIIRVISNGQKGDCTRQDLQDFFVAYLKRIKPKSSPVAWGCTPRPPKKREENYLYDAERIESVFEVTRLGDYINELAKNNKKVVDHNGGLQFGKAWPPHISLYYRGHKNTSYSLVPSVYRKAEWREHEKEMCEDLERLCPERFAHMHSQLERLVEMQHYELPTRMLDISESAISALLFACDIESDADKEVDGEVLVLCCKNTPKYGRSDTVSMLCMLSQLKPKERQRLLFLTNYVLSLLAAGKNINSLRTKLEEEVAISDPSLKNDSVLKQALAHISPGIGNFLKAQMEKDAEFDKVVNKEYLQTLIRERYNATSIVDVLVRKIQYDKPSFSARIDPKDLTSVQFVLPAMANPRIVKQSGAFMVAGLIPEDMGDAMQKTNRFRLGFGESEKKTLGIGKATLFIVPGDKKTDLLKELEMCDFHRAAIYPDIDKVAKYIQEKKYTKHSSQAMDEEEN